MSGKIEEASNGGCVKRYSEKKVEMTREIKRRNRRERNYDAAEEGRIDGNHGKRKKPEDVKKRE